jgi:hypothetical protein
MKGKRVQEFLPPLIEERWRTVFNPVRARKEPVKSYDADRIQGYALAQDRDACRAVG